MKNVLPTLAERIEHARLVIKIRDALLGTLSYNNDGPRPIGDGGDYLESGPNHFYNQTGSGFHIQCYYGMPNDLWTPWGKISLWGSGIGHFEDLHSKQLALLGGTVAAPSHTTEEGVFGPWWNITKVGDETLPTYKPRKMHEFVHYEDARADWKETVEAANLTKTFRV